MSKPGLQHPYNLSLPKFLNYHSSKVNLIKAVQNVFESNFWKTKLSSLTLFTKLDYYSNIFSFNSNSHISPNTTLYFFSPGQGASWISFWHLILFGTKMTSILLTMKKNANSSKQPSKAHSKLYKTATILFV